MVAQLAQFSAAGLRRTLGEFRIGRADRTTRLGPGSFTRATLTPDGPGTIHIRWSADAIVDAEAWGPGAGWLVDRVPAMTGQLDDPAPLPDLHPAVTAAAHRHPHLRIGASGTLYHELLPTILGQRITAAEATMQWHRVVQRLGEPAPGPFHDLLLPPAPHALAAQPSWWFHPLGIERKRADALRSVARAAHHLWEWAELPAGACAQRLSLLSGVGEWTIGCVLGTALGCPDAIAVGDYHLKNIVCFALTGQPRGSDEHMVELLEPFRPQRGRVTRLLSLDGFRAPKFGPRQRILPMHRW
jgi:3-methyladenine DNA glycosylase/8-oxoguanine DNA glycosylase